MLLQRRDVYTLSASIYFKLEIKSIIAILAGHLYTMFNT